MDTGVKYNATGRRKAAIARLYLGLGTGNIKVNGKDIKDYFHNVERLLLNIMQPLVLLEVEKKFDISVNLCGGGMTGQAEALRHAISRALIDYDPSYRSALKKAGFLTRDSRVKERKKYGHKKARKSFQFSKR